jgi:hypothetical protein
MRKMEFLKLRDEETLVLGAGPSHKGSKIMNGVLLGAEFF